MTHFRILESWRLMAALAVMMWHFLRFAPPGHDEASAFLYRLLPLMEMFFMISGFLIVLRYMDRLLLSPGSYRSFLLRRFARLYPLYLATLAFFMVVGAAVHLGWIPSDYPRRYDFSILPQNLLLLQGWGTTSELSFNYVGWTLSAEWFCYLTLPLIILVARQGGVFGLVVLSAVAIALLETGTGLGIIPFESWLKADTWGAYRAFADFTLGGVMALLVRNFRWTLRSPLYAWTTFSLALFAMLDEQNGYLVLGLLGLSIIFAAVSEQNNPAGSAFLRPVHPIGKVSFGIYLIHPVAEAIFFSALWRQVIGPSELIGFYWYWLVPAFVTIAVAMLSDRYFEGPVSRLILDRFDRNDSRTGVAVTQAA